MGHPAKNAPCPCHSGRKAKACCGPVLEGAPAATPEALMRSRYTAYAARNLGHLMRTTSPDSPHRGADPASWAEELGAFCDAVSFDGLDVLSATSDGDSGTVEFFATLRAGDRDASFGERSRFRRIDGRWTYVDGERLLQ